MKDRVALNRSLGLSAVIAFGFCFISPMGIFSLYGFSAPLAEGHLALAYILGALAIFLTALSYGKMVKKFPIAGSAYSYAKNTAGTSAGFFVGWTVLLDYFLLPLLCVALAANYVHGELLPDVPLPYTVVFFTLLMTAANLVGIKTTTGFSKLLFILQLLVVLAFIIAAVVLVVNRDGVQALVPSASSDNVRLLAVAAAAALICNTFLGFDAVTTLAEETRDPARVIPKAIVIVSAGVGGLFTLIAFIAFVAYPATDFANPASASVELSRVIGGPLFAEVFLAGCIISSFASAVVSQASAARILYAMGRDGALPKSIFGRLSAKTQVPMISTLILSAISLLAAFIDTDAIASAVNFGAFTAFGVTNLAVILQYVVKDREFAPRQLLGNLILPALGFIVVVGLWTQLDLRANLLGITWVGIGIVYALFVTKGFSKPMPDLSVSLDSDARDETAAQRG